MKLNLLPILAAGAITLAGCSTPPARLATGTVHARTFSFVQPGPKTTPAYADNRQAVHAMIQEAISGHLAAKGVARVAGGGEVTVAYLVIVGNNATTTSINDYFGYGSDATALSEKAHAAYTGSKNPNYFEAGTLVIDLVETKTFKLLKRGYATRPILRELPADARAARLREVVDEILQDVQFRP